MTTNTTLRFGLNLLLTGLLAAGLTALADRLASATDGLLPAQLYAGDPQSPNHGANEGITQPTTPREPKAVPSGSAFVA